MGIDELHEFAEKLGEQSIEDCVYFELQSGIPQIDYDVFDSMEKIETLNIIANEYLMLPEAKRALFKAVVEAESISELEDMQKVFERLDKYELCIEDENADEFFKRFLAYHARQISIPSGWTRYPHTMTQKNCSKHSARRLPITVLYQPAADRFMRMSRFRLRKLKVMLMTLN